MTNFKIVHSTELPEEARVHVLDLQGQLDAHTFGTLQGKLDDLIAQDQSKVVLHCSQLEYISSAGLGVLKRMTREFRARQGDIRLAGLSSKINTVVNLLGFSHVIRVFPDLAAAVNSYQSSKGGQAASD